MGIAIEPIVPGDVAAVVKLLREFAEFEKLSEYCEVTDERLHAAMFGDGAFVEGLIVTDDGTPLGYALYYPSFSSFRGQCGVYLEDLFVKNEYRGQGVGEAVIKQIARMAAERGLVRIDFMVLDWNMPAVRFYNKLGAVRDDDERHFKFTDEVFASLADLNN